MSWFTIDPIAVSRGGRTPSFLRPTTAVREVLTGTVMRPWPLLLVAAASCAPSTPEDAESADEIIGGATAEPVASMYLTTGCTATRVGEQHILTAAHCVLADGRVKDAYVEGASFGYDTGWHVGSAPRRFAHVQQLIFGEQFGVDHTGPDYALIVTREGLGDALPIAKVDLDPVGPGEQVLLSGYGCTERWERVARSSIDFGAGYSIVASADGDYVYTSGPGVGAFAGMCPGDSGGPLYRGGAVVGINASGWWNADKITTKSSHTRVDASSAAGQRLAAAGVHVCHASQGTCGGGREPHWLSGKLTVFDKCIAPKDNGSENGTPLVIVPCNGDRNQRWTARPDHTLVHDASGRCFDMAEPHAGAPFHLWDCHGGQNQRFSGGDGGELRTDTGFCVDASAGSSENGTPLIGWSCHGERNQQIGYWFF